MKSYGQFCALARTLDIVGDRWTLLIVRDLLVGDATFGELQHGLPGIATNILTERLRQLEAHQILWRKRDGRQARYGLTERGRELSDAVHALIRWGAPEMTRGAGDDLVRIEWLVVALDALTHPSPTDGRIAFRVDDQTIGLDVRTGEVELAPMPAPGDLQVETNMEGVLALLSGHASLRSLVHAGGARCARIEPAQQLIRAAIQAGGRTSAPTDAPALHP